MFLPVWLIAIVIAWLVYLLINVIKLRHYVLRLKEIIFLLEQTDLKPEIKQKIVAREQVKDKLEKPPTDMESRLGDMEERGWDGSYK